MSENTRRHGAVCGLCGKAAMYTVTINSKTVCEDCAEHAKAITDPEARRAVYSGLEVSLDGKPAFIHGFLEDFATVGTRDGHGPAFQWAWSTVAHVVRHEGGRFKS